MEKKVKCIDVRTADGTPIVKLYISEQDVTLGEVPNRSPAPNKQARNSAAQTNSQAANDSSMTDAQKRYLFRILAEQGLDADKAHEHLKKLFGVESLQEINKFEASRMIESLLEKAESR
jgi:formate dehydrogenase maturation protein FdhE